MIDGKTAIERITNRLKAEETAHKLFRGLREKGEDETGIIELMYSEGNTEGLVALCYEYYWQIYRLKTKK